MNKTRDQEESQEKSFSDRISIEVPNEIIVKDLLPVKQGKDQLRIKDAKKNSDNSSTFGSAILPP